MIDYVLIMENFRVRRVLTDWNSVCHVAVQDNSYVLIFMMLKAKVFIQHEIKVHDYDELMRWRLLMFDHNYIVTWTE